MTLSSAAALTMSQTEDSIDPGASLRWKHEMFPVLQEASRLLSPPAPCAAGPSLRLLGNSLQEPQGRGTGAAGSQRVNSGVVTTAASSPPGKQTLLSPPQTLLSLRNERETRSGAAMDYLFYLKSAGYNCVRMKFVVVSRKKKLTTAQC